MSTSKVKYQIVVSHDSGEQMVMSSHSTLEEAQESYKTTDMAMKSGIGNMIIRDPDWNELELQRVEVLQG